MISGSLVAIVTPMRNDGLIDWECMRLLLDHHVAEGTKGVVIAGTTGESPTLSVEEHCKLIAEAVQTVAGRIPIIAGTGANSTTEAIALSKRAANDGADYALSVVPYYNKPTQEGMYQHFKAVAEAVDLPTILYNVPGRTGADLHNETAFRLAEVPGVIGIKDATGDLERGKELISAAIDDFAVLSGDDGTCCEYMIAGGHGTISVTANVAPKLMSLMSDAAISGDADTARKINQRLAPFHKAQSIESNPIPVKWALHSMGKIEAGIRLPLCPLSEKHRKSVEDAVAAFTEGDA